MMMEMMQKVMDDEMDEMLLSILKICELTVDACVLIWMV